MCSSDLLRVQRDRHLTVHRRHRRVEVPQRYQRARQRSETPLQRQTESSSSATPAAKRAESRAGHERPSGAPKAPRCLPAGHPNRPTTLNAETVGGSRRMPWTATSVADTVAALKVEPARVMHQPTTVTVSALPSGYDAAGSTGRPGCCRGRPPWWRYQCRRWQCARSRRHAVTAAVGVATTLVVATPGRRHRC